MSNKLSTYKNLHACTIVAKNYLAAARVLAESFLAIHEGATFTTLVLDDRAGTIDSAQEPFRVFGLENIGLSQEEITEMTAIYTVMELATAVKPWLLETLLNEAEAVLYLDPDIKVYSPLDELFIAAKEGKIVLTPHAVKPMPRDNKTTDETAVLSSGIYNLGFIGLGKDKKNADKEKPCIKDFLAFWEERLKKECYVDIANMRFVDQRWIDFVPGIYDVAIIKNPVYNVAYWNLDHREIGYEDGRYTVNGMPLAFFHFSGYNPHLPHLLSKHQGEKPRILFSEHPQLKKLCDEYGQDLMAQGFDKTTKEPYLYDRLGNGIKLDQFSRRLYRDALLKASNENHGTQTETHSPPGPFYKDGNDFVIWLNEPPEDLTAKMASSVHQPSPIRLYNNAYPSRYLLAIHQARVDLQAAFPDPLGTDQYRLVEWADNEAILGRLDPRLVPGSPAAKELLKLASGKSYNHQSATTANIPLPRSQTRAGGRHDKPILADSSDHLIPGMRVTGYFQAETGTGEHARLVLSAVEKAGITAGAYIDNNMISRQSHTFDYPDRNDLNTNVVCINADQLPHFAEKVGREFFEGRYNIGLWAWELEEMPEHFAKAASCLDEIWANSSFTQQAISKITDKPVFSFPLPVKEPIITKKFDRKRLGIGSEPMFLFCFDLMSVMERKNPLGLIEAFSMAFQDGEGPKLVIKAVGGEHKIADLEKLKYAASKRSDIIIFDSYLSFEENAALIESCDCYVSLHRSEGFGLTLAEAMALAKPVISTKYSGNLDFMTHENSFLVPFEHVNIPSGCDPYPSSMKWADPDLEMAAGFMRDVVEKPDLAKEKGLLAKSQVLQMHGLEARIQFIKTRFDFAQNYLSTEGNKVSVQKINTPQIPQDPPLIALAKSTPNLSTPSKKGVFAKAYRKVLYKALRHHDEHQRQLDIAMAAGIEHVARLITEYGQVINDLQTNISEIRKSLTDDVEPKSGHIELNTKQTKSNLQRIHDLEKQLFEIRELIYSQKTVIKSQEDRFASDIKKFLTIKDELDALESHFERLTEEVSIIDGKEKRRKLLEIEKMLEQLKTMPLSSMFDKPEYLIKGVDGFSTLGYDLVLEKNAKSYLEIIDQQISAGDKKKTRGNDNYTTQSALESTSDEQDSSPIWSAKSLWDTSDMVSERQKSYLKLLSAYEGVVDLGCGRGELLELLRTFGIAAKGIEKDADLVLLCQRAGLDVICLDFLDYLSSIKKKTKSAIVAASIVEYLSDSDLTRLIKLAYNALLPGSMLLLEMKNPYHIKSFVNTWTDPDTIRPIAPEVLLLKCHETGFQRAELFFPLGTGEYKNDLAEQDYYAIIAYA